MTDVNKVRKFFNGYADKWDEYWINDKAISAVFDLLDLPDDSNILDIGCGTGVLVPYYGNRTVDAIDVSDKMIEICKRKYKDHENTSFHRTALYDFKPDRKYDLAMMYNVFPHLSDHERLFPFLKTLLKENGRMVIAHGLSIKQLNIHHRNTGSDISEPFPEMEELIDQISRTFTVTKVISNEEMICLIAVNDK